MTPVSRMPSRAVMAWLSGTILATALLAACGGGSAPAGLPRTTANVTMCRAFAFTISNDAPVQDLAVSLVSAGQSVSYPLRHALAVFVADTNGSTGNAVADGLRVRHDCLSIQAPTP